MAQKKSTPPSRTSKWFTALIAVLSFALGNFTNLSNVYDKFREPLSLEPPILLPAKGTFHRIYRNAGESLTAAPANFLMHVKLHNRSSSQISIVSYSMFVKTDRGWEKLAALRDAVGPHVSSTVVTFHAERGKHEWQGMRGVDLSKEGFDFKAIDSPIPAGGLLSGWMFFESYPIGQITAVRGEFIDQNGSIHTIESNVEPSKPEETSLIRAPIPVGAPEPIPPELLTYSQAFPVPDSIANAPAPLHP